MSLSKLLNLSQPQLPRAWNKGTKTLLTRSSRGLRNTGRVPAWDSHLHNSGSLFPKESSNPESEGSPQTPSFPADLQEAMVVPTPSLSVSWPLCVECPRTRASLGPAPSHPSLPSGPLTMYLKLHHPPCHSVPLCLPSWSEMMHGVCVLCLSLSLQCQIREGSLSPDAPAKAGHTCPSVRFCDRLSR